MRAYYVFYDVSLRNVACLAFETKCQAEDMARWIDDQGVPDGRIWLG